LTLPIIRRLCASALFLACLIAGAGPSSEAAVFNPETFTLDNGMQVVVITNRRAPVVTHHVWYRIGSSDSPLGKSGLPHFHEHLMFKATEELASGEFSKEVAKNGGNDNAFTGPDYTGYFQTIARDRLELVMKMEADRMTNLVLAEDEVLRERDVVLEERSQRVDNNPSARFAEQMNAAQFLHHPDRKSVVYLFPRRQFGLLSNLVCAQQRGPPGRRRYRCRGAETACREILRRHPRKRHPRARPRAGTAAGGGAYAHPP